MVNGQFFSLVNFKFTYEVKFTIANSLSCTPNRIRTYTISFGG